MTVPPRQLARVATVVLYVVVLAAALLEKPGQTTNDTKTSLIDAPGAFLRSAFHLWNPDVSLGELQNQAYGYLFPQGPFFLLGELAHVPPWITERLWSVALIIVGCEGGRRLAAALGLSVWPAWLAGVAYGLNPRVVGQVATRSAEILPGVVLPWVVLPLVLALSGRLRPRTGALWSAAAFVFVGAANGTATMAVLPLPLILIVWGCRRGAAPWSLLGWWSAFVAVSNVWWAASLWKLKDYSPPFFDYVEDARVTTDTSGFGGALRGLGNWVDFMYFGDHAAWPAGFALAYEPWLVGATLMIAAAGAFGLASWRSPWRGPLLLSAAIGLFCQVIAHEWMFASPVDGFFRDVLDGPFALLRNVHKIDPVLRLPLAIGVGVALGVSLGSRRAWWPGIRVVALVVVVLSMLQPVISLNLRSPGWDKIPDYWTATADWLEDAPAPRKAWIVPGSGFAIQTWGWTMDEPMSAVGRTPWLTRSQVPLVPSTTLLMMDQLESTLQTGSGSPYLGRMLARLGVGYVVVRTDLDLTSADGISPSLVGIALARSGGVERVAQFGGGGGALPAIEVYRVEVDTTAKEYSLTPEDQVVTVAGASPDVLDAVGRGLVRPGSAAVVQGDDGWDRPADVVGDAFRLRARNYGQIHDADGALLSAGEPTHIDRVVLNYPGNQGSRPVAAEYDGVKFVDASTSQAFPFEVGGLRPENLPFAAVDGNYETGWRSGYFKHPEGQWLEVRFDEPRRIDDIVVNSPGRSGPVVFTRTWKVSAGDVEKEMRINPFTGVGRVDLGDARSDRVRFTATDVEVEESREFAAVSLLEVRFADLPAERTLRVPDYETADPTTFMFGARPETRSCIPTLLAPDCTPWRFRGAEEGAGIDRTFTVDHAGTFSFRGRAVARSTPQTIPLLNGFGSSVNVSGSSTFENDPAVAPRLVHDGSDTTSWMAKPEDRQPTLTVAFAKPRTLSRIAVRAPARPAVSPTQVVISNGEETREVTLDELGLFEPIHGRQFTLEFRNPTSFAPIGISELHLSPRSVAVPFRGEDPSGAFCGSGPPLVIDGHRFRTRVQAMVGDVYSGTPVGVLPCDGLIELDAGEHRFTLETNDRWQPLSALLSSGGTHVDSRERRTLEVVKEADNEQLLELGPGDAAVLSTSRNFNAGWSATLDGEPLAVQRVDGWAQGWRIPEEQGGTLRIWFAPQMSYFLALVGGLVIAGLLLLAAAVSLVRTPRSQPHKPPLVSAQHRGSRRSVWMVPLVPLAWLVGGPIAAAGALLGWLLRFRRLGDSRLSAPLAFMLIGVGGIVYAIQLTEHPIVSSRASDVLAALGIMVALVSAPALPRSRSAAK
jgi:arabinofuranan 3-O-arabinosyltransferase